MDAILFLDLAGDVRGGLYKDSMNDLFAIDSPQTVLEMEKNIRNELDKPENALVKETIELRKQLMNEVRKRIDYCCGRSRYRP